MKGSEAFDRLNRAWDIRKGAQAKRGGKREYALGRLPQGDLNKTEARYLAEVIEPALAAGELLWARFGGIKLKLAANTFITVDFATVPAAAPVLTFVDVKGAEIMFAEDAKAKMKVAAAQYPFRFFVTWPVRGKGWERKEITG